jgi:hypothetical protein
MCEEKWNLLVRGREGEPRRMDQGTVSGPHSFRSDYPTNAEQGLELRMLPVRKGTGTLVDF